MDCLTSSYRGKAITNRDAIRDISSALVSANQRIVGVMKDMIDQDYLNITDLEAAIAELEKVKNTAANWELLYGASGN